MGGLTMREGLTVGRSLSAAAIVRLRRAAVNGVLLQAFDHQHVALCPREPFEFGIDSSCHFLEAATLIKVLRGIGGECMQRHLTEAAPAGVLFGIRQNRFTEAPASEPGRDVDFSDDVRAGRLRRHESSLEP